MPGSLIDRFETVIASEATTKNQPPETDIIVFQMRFGMACGTSSRQNRPHDVRWYMRGRFDEVARSVRKDWNTLNAMFQACEVKIAKIAAHSTPNRLPGNSAMNPVTVIERKPRIGTDCSTSSAGISSFSPGGFWPPAPRSRG